jgi:hypothetical protein
MVGTRQSADLFPLSTQLNTAAMALLQAQSLAQAASCDAQPFSTHDQQAPSGGGSVVTRLGPGEHAPPSSPRSSSPVLPDEEPPDEPLAEKLPDEEPPDAPLDETLPDDEAPDEEPPSMVDPVRPSLCSAST